MLPILGQMMTLWSFLLSWLWLKRKFSAVQIAGAVLVAVGAAIVACRDPSSALEVDVSAAALYSGSLLLPAIATILKV